jgi:hypothetical protein
MTTIKIYDRIVLTEDLPSTLLKKEDVGTVVEIYKNGEAYEVEFFALDGSTLAVETVAAHLVKPVSGKMVLHTRELAA